MSGLGDHLSRVVTGGRPADVPAGWRERLAELVRAHGSERAVGRAGYGDPRTWQRARKAEAAGKTYRPAKATMAKLARGVRDTHVRRGASADGAATPLTVDDGRDTGRAVTARQMGLAPGTMARVVQAYRDTGNQELMARVFVAGVTNGFYKDALAQGLDSEGNDDEDQDDDDDDEGGDLADLYEDVDDDQGSHDEPGSPVVFIVV